MTRKKKLSVGIVIITLLLAFTYVNLIGNGGYTFSKEDASPLVVEFIDVGQGDCILLEQGGKSMLIDTGSYSEYDSVKRELGKRGIKKLDYLCVTHMDSDHMQSASDVVYDYNVQTVMTVDNFDKDTRCVKEFKKSLSKVKNVYYVRKGDVLALGDAVIRVLAPVKNEKGAYDDSNDYSIVMKVTYWSKSFLFTGDETGSEYNKSIKAGADYDSDVVKLMHHGSSQNGSNHEMFFKVTTPDYVVISCGKDNEYGYPHKEVLSLIDKYNIKSYRTDEMGDITFIASKEKISVEY